jgi:hypothetical protein
MNHTTMTLNPGMGMDMEGMEHMMMQMPAMFWVQGNTDADGSGAAYVTGAGSVQRFPHPKWASHLLESDPEYNLWDVGMANRSMRRRHAQSQPQSQPSPLSASSLTDALALFGSDPAGNPKLLAMGLDVNRNVDVSQPGVLEQFKGWVPAPMLEAAKDVAALRKQLRGETDEEEEEEVALLRVENTLLDYCGVCEAEGPVFGAGMEVCDVEASCQSLQARAPPAVQPLFDYDQVRGVAWRAWCYIAQGGVDRSIPVLSSTPHARQPPSLTSIMLPPIPSSHLAPRTACVRPAGPGDCGLPPDHSGGPGGGRPGLPACAAGLPAGQRHHGLPGHGFSRPALPPRLRLFVRGGLRHAARAPGLQPGQRRVPPHAPHPRRLRGACWLPCHAVLARC